MMGKSLTGRCLTTGTCFRHKFASQPPRSCNYLQKQRGLQLIAAQEDENGVHDSELPEQLQGLRISKNGQDLIDSKTGEMVNAFGATRFDVAVHALRGDFDPPKQAENSERASNLLIGALKQFPMEYMFNLVYKLDQKEDQSVERQAISVDVREKLERVCGCVVPEEACILAERMNGKYISAKVVAQVQHAGMIAKAYDELGQDSRVIMKF